MIADKEMVNRHFLHSPFSPQCIIAALAFADVAVRSMEKTQKETSSFSFSPFHVKTAQLPTIDKCKEQQSGLEEGGG